MQVSLFLALVIGQPLPPIPLPPLPAAEPIGYPVDAYSAARIKALTENKRLAVFVGMPVRQIPGVVSVRVERENDFAQYENRLLVVYAPIKGLPHELYKLGILDPNVPDAEIQFGGKTEVKPAATPFERFNDFNPGPRTAEASPWLSVGEHKRIWDMWPDGVPYPATLAFYKLKPAGQRVAAFDRPGAGNNRPFVSVSDGDENPNREFPWVGSGGMDFATPGTWRNVTGMALPKGEKIRWWLGPVPVTNSGGSVQQEVGMHWEFPQGTQMFDVLVRRADDGSEHIFNIRRRIKVAATSWDDGASFFPDVEAGKVNTYYTLGSARSRRVLGIPQIAYRVAEVSPISDRKPVFKQAEQTTLALNDGGHFFPPGFKGAGMSCNKCHSGAAMESKEYGGPLLRGKDTCFSFYPVPQSFVMNGSGGLSSEVFAAVHTPPVDTRWPLQYVQR